MSNAIYSLSHQVLKTLLDKVDKFTESPPPDEHDIHIFVPGAMPSLDVPIPDDVEIRRAFSERLGQPVNDELVDAFLAKVWSAEPATEATDVRATEGASSP
ncbi:hypothetical protein QN239_07055 [Mycolicibacterium sp. Y3]